MDSAVVSAWLLVEDQVYVGMAGPSGVNWPGVMAALRAEGIWDDEHDCLPDGLFEALRVLFQQLLSWKTCPACRDAERDRVHVCSKCGEEYTDRPSPEGHRGPGLLKGY
ncbi:MAG: hypothetical protein ABR961_03380 [Thermoanaerobaculaceae bacterium]